MLYQTELRHLAMPASVLSEHVRSETIQFVADQAHAALEHLDHCGVNHLRLVPDDNNALAIHFGVFPLADDGFDDAERTFLKARTDAGIPPDVFRTLLPGECWRMA